MLALGAKLRKEALRQYERIRRIRRRKNQNQNQMKIHGAGGPKPGKSPGAATNWTRYVAVSPLCSEVSAASEDQNAVMRREAGEGE